MHKRRLPIANPCREEWDAMRPDGAGRHCERCDYTVVDLSVLTEREAKRVVESRRGKLCVRYLAGADGELLFRAPPLRRGVERLAIGLGLASLLYGAAPAFADASLSRPATGRVQSGRELASAAQLAVIAAAPAPSARPGRHQPVEPSPAPEPRPEYFMGDIKTE